MGGLKEELLKSIWHAFTALDLDRSGKVSKSQLKARRGARGAGGRGRTEGAAAAPRCASGPAPAACPRCPSGRDPPWGGRRVAAAGAGCVRGGARGLPRGPRGATVRPYRSANRGISREAPAVPLSPGSRSEVAFVLLTELSGSSLNPVPSWPCFTGPSWPGRNGQHPTK